MKIFKSIWNKLYQKKQYPIVISNEQIIIEKENEMLDYIHVHVDEMPDNFESKKIYIIGEDGYEWLAAFKCPCGCNEVIQLNLLHETRPCWRVIYHKNNTISISPSIRRERNCKSHFNINRNTVKWWGWK